MYRVSRKKNDRAFWCTCEDGPPRGTRVAAWGHGARRDTERRGCVTPMRGLRSSQDLLARMGSPPASSLFHDDVKHRCLIHFLRFSLSFNAMCILSYRVCTAQDNDYPGAHKHSFQNIYTRNRALQPMCTRFSSNRSVHRLSKPGLLATAD